MDDQQAVRLRSDPRRVADMFGRIAGRYDLMNRLMTAGLDRQWRRLAAEQAVLGAGERALDVCCGTGDLTIELARRHPGAQVTGLDLSEPMLARAADKARLAGLREPGVHVEAPASRAAGGLAPADAADALRASSVRFVCADAHRPPFSADEFAAVTAAFGVRNLPDLPLAFAGLLRVTRPGGRFVCLEITTPPAGMGRRFHRLWFDRCVPLLGRFLAGDSAAYSYLPASVRAFPDADGLARTLYDAGWRRIRFRRLGMGIVALHVAEKPVAHAGRPT